MAAGRWLILQVEWEVSANDNISGDLSSSVVCAPMSGSVFKANTTGINTPVICSVTDGAGNVASMSFHVITTTDTTPPIITKTSPTTDMNYVTKEVSTQGISLYASSVSRIRVSLRKDKEEEAELDYNNPTSSSFQ